VSLPAPFKWSGYYSEFPNGPDCDRSVEILQISYDVSLGKIVMSKWAGTPSLNFQRPAGLFHYYLQIHAVYGFCDGTRVPLKMYCLWLCGSSTHEGNGF
jgi:hypothetical protein